jgi:putative heme-binding domain-containing protein
MTIRAAALRSLLKIDVEKNVALAGDILQNDSVPEYQRRIAAVLGEFPGGAVNKTLEGLKNIRPELQGTIAIALAGSPEGKDILLRKIKQGELLPRILLEPRVEERVLSKASSQQEKEFANLTAGVEPISKQKQAFIEKRLLAFESLNRNSLNLDSGRMVFEQNCGVCHKTGGQVGIAPQLAGAGKRGARGLMEKILDPNRNISQAFRNYTIKMKDGTIKSGLHRRDEGEAKVFADLTGKEFSVSRKDIAALNVSKYTLMPDSFDSSISEKEFNKLICYLLSL